MTGRVERVMVVTDEVVEALGRLIPQMGPNRSAPSRGQVEAVVGSADALLLVLRDDSGRVQATTTVSFLVRLMGRRAWIEDVVVDAGARRLGYGRRIVEAAIDAARARGVYSIRLTSGAQRAEAHQLYESLGFGRQDTRVYEIRPEQPGVG